MARKKELRKPYALSQEYVVDSDSEGLPEIDYRGQLGHSNGDRGGPSPKKQKNDKTTSSRSGTEAGNPGSAVNGDDDGSVASSSSAEGKSAKEMSDHAGKTQAPPKPQKKKSASMTNSPPTIIPARPFRPPNGFQEVQVNAPGFTTDALGALSGDLTDKQVWHIAAPASIPLSLIKTFNPEAVRNGSPILAYEERQFGFSSGSKDDKYLFLPGNAGGIYKRLKTSISKSYHLREIPDHSQMTRPDDSENPEATEFFAKTAPSPRSPPKQPEMLKMRYKPFGTEDSPTAFSDSDEIPAKEERSTPTPPPTSSSPHTSTLKKIKKQHKKEKEKSKRPNPNEEVVPGDDSEQMDWAPAQTTVARETSPQAEMPALELSKDIDGQRVKMVTPGKKKKRAKSREERSS